MAQDRVFQIFRDAGAILEGHFQLASGRHSGTYLEKFQVLQYPEHTAALCRLIADHFREARPDLVAGPTTGGIILGYEVARQIGVRGIFAEREGEARRFGRGFEVRPGERVLVVDDILTTGGSIRQVLDAVRQAEGEPIGVGVLVDRTGGQAAFDDLPLFSCLQLEIASHDPADCPLCRKQVPLKVT